MILEEQGDLSVLGVLEDEYEIMAELGRGGSAVVYRARDRALGRDVAIKVVQGRAGSIDDENIARLAREARMVAQLQHLLIVSVYAVKRVPNGLALVMQWVPGRTLKQVILEDGALDTERAEQVMRDIAMALAYAHTRGVIHRDVKPENIFLDAESGRALLSDFGIAHSSEFDSRLTMTGTAIGTPAYMAPEQIDGAAANARSDVYSLGLVTWEMLAGQRPWEGESLYRVLFKQKHDDLPALDELRRDMPERLLYVVERALQKRPAARWAGASALLAHLDTPTLPPDWKQWRTARRKRRSRQESDDASRVPSFLAAALQTIRFRRPEGGERFSREDPDRVGAATVSGTAVTSSGDDRSARVNDGVGADVGDEVGNDEPTWVHEERDTRSRWVVLSAISALVLAVAGGLSWYAMRGEENPAVRISVADNTEPARVEVSVGAPAAIALPSSAVAADSLDLVARLVDPASFGGLSQQTQPGVLAVEHAETTTRQSPGTASREATVRTPRRTLPPPPSLPGAVVAAAAAVAPAASAVVSATSDRGVIAAGGRHSCELLNGAAYCWGANEHGQLGTGEFARREVPVPVRGDLEFTQLSAGVSHTCGTTRSGDAYCWGADQYGQLGDATRISRDAPVRVVSNLTFRQVYAGRHHSCALTTGGQVACWGANGSGELGDGTTNARPTPALIATNARFIAVAIGWQHSCAITIEGEAFCWGDNAAGQLGAGSGASSRSPVAVVSPTRFTSITAGSGHSCAVSEQGDLYCWGRNSFGQLGNGSTASQNVPTRIQTLSRFVSTTAGSVHSCARTTAGAVYCWGRNSYGQVGDGTMTDRAVPVRVGGGADFRAVNTSGAHTCAVPPTGDALCWGYNVDGQLGDGTRAHQPRPVRVATPAAPGR